MTDQSFDEVDLPGELSDIDRENIMDGMDGRTLDEAENEETEMVDNLDNRELDWDCATPDLDDIINVVDLEYGVIITKGVGILGEGSFYFIDDSEVLYDMLTSLPDDQCKLSEVWEIVVQLRNK